MFDCMEGTLEWITYQLVFNYEHNMVWLPIFKIVTMKTLLIYFNSIHCKYLIHYTWDKKYQIKIVPWVSV